MNFCRNCGGSLIAPGSPPPPADLATLRGRPKSAANAATVSCPSCGGQTPEGFAFCQQCGQKIPPAGARGAGVPAGGPARGVVSGETGVDGTAPTLAADGDRAAAMLGASLGASAGPAWGALVSVNSDGSDGQRFALAGEFVDVGRTEGEIRFEGDQFLARRHARLTRSGAGVRVTPLDTLNGVFRRVTEPTPLTDGAIVLLGREVLRFELVSAEERAAVPLVQHGVVFFGSPPREPWGRLVQLLPSRAACDVRHLWDDSVVVGREAGDIVFRDDAFLSRRHAAVLRQGDRYVLEDLDSSNGTFLQIAAPIELRSGDHLRMGDQLFRIELS